MIVEAYMWAGYFFSYCIFLINGVKSIRMLNRKLFKEDQFPCVPGCITRHVSACSVISVSPIDSLSVYIRSVL